MGPRPSLAASGLSRFMLMMAMAMMMDMNVMALQYRIVSSRLVSSLFNISFDVQSTKLAAKCSSLYGGWMDEGGVVLTWPYRKASIENRVCMYSKIL